MSDSRLRSSPTIIVFSLGLACLVAATACAQTADLPSAPTPHTALIKLAGNMVVEQGTGQPMPLTLDEAVELGLKHNLQLTLARQNQRLVHGEVLTVANNLLPSLTAKATTGTQSINLAAMGFKPSSLESFGIPPSQFKTIVKVSTTSAQLNMDQQLFNVPAYYLYRAAQKADRVASMTELNQEGAVTVNVASQYLLALADASEIENARALVKADQVAFQQADDSHKQGVGTNLDVLRARVQLQTEQQTLISAEDTFSKDKIILNRMMGIPADQELTLTDKAPYSQFSELPLDEAKKTAYSRRKDLLSLEAQLEVAERASKAVKFERLPSLSFNGRYGVIGETHGLYHGDFTAQGKLSVPIFEEGQLRGEREVADAQADALRKQIASLRVTIDEQIRSAMLDVNSSAQLVEVARSNVDLAREELDQASQRFTAGVDDNLAVVRAQAALAQAQTQLISTLYQYNVSKLLLARNTGVVESQYKSYLGL